MARGLGVGWNGVGWNGVGWGWVCGPGLELLGGEEERHPLAARELPRVDGPGEGGSVGLGSVMQCMDAGPGGRRVGMLTGRQDLA
jgi:hypothetical protein